MKIKTAILLTLAFIILSGCNSPKDLIIGRTNTSYYYDAWYGEVSSEIRYFGQDAVDVVEVGFDSPSNSELWGFVLPENQLPVLPEFLMIKIGEESFSIHDLSLEIVQRLAGNMGHKAGYFEWGDSTRFYTRDMTVIFYGDRLVYLRCDSEGTKFTNVKTGKSASLPMTVSKMKKIFGEPDRIKKWSVL